MKVLVASALLMITTGCLTDPPYRPYSGQPQRGYDQQQQQPNQPPPGQYADPNSPNGTSNYPTYQTNLNGPPAGPQPPPYVAPQGGVSVQPTNGGPPPLTGAPPTGGPPPMSPPVSSSAAGRYQCWVAGAGMYAQSALGLVTLDFNNSYSSTQNQTATGTYRVDGTRVYFTGGSLAGYVGVLESNQNGPLLRLRTEVPNDPGVALRIGDHVCYLVR